MAEQSIESLTGMGLLPKNKNIITELVSIRDKKRQTYYDKFLAGRNNLTDFRNVKWGLDGEGNDCGIRCNANIVLLEIGAKIPALADGSRGVKEITPIYVFPAKTLREWGVANLTCSHSSYKGMDRVMISEPSRMPVPRFYEYLPKNVFKIRDE